MGCIVLDLEIKALCSSGEESSHVESKITGGGVGEVRADGKRRIVGERLLRAVTLLQMKCTHNKLLKRVHVDTYKPANQPFFFFFHTHTHSGMQASTVRSM